MSYILALEKIHRTNPALATKIKSHDGFLMEDDIEPLIKIDRLQLVLVRCGGGRFLCPAQDVKHFVSIIEEHAALKSEKTGNALEGEYIRDVSLPA